MYFLISKGVPALPPKSFGYRHFSRKPFYTAGGGLYKWPESVTQSQAMFYPSPEKMQLFPMGGHDYYSGRDLELLRKITAWLAKADVERPGWEDRYRALARTKPS